MTTGSHIHFGPSPVRRGRRCKSCFGVLLIGLFVAFGQYSSALADQVQVRAAVHQYHGRVVFEWPEPTGFSTQINGNELVIRFDRSFEGDVAEIADTLANYVRTAGVSNDGRAVELSLTTPFEVRTSHYDTSVVLDLLSGTGPASTGGLDGPGVRVGEHNGFTRTVFDWSQNVTYQVEEANNQITVSFSRPGSPDLGRFSEDPPRYIRRVTARSEDNGLTVVLDVDTGTSMRHFRDGNRIVIDIQRGSARTSTAPATQSAAKEEVQQAPPRAQPRAAVETRPVPQSAADSGAYQLRLEVASLPTGVRIVFPWENPTPAAIFQRADYLWVIFSRASHVDFSNLISEFSDRLITAEQLPNQYATILRFKIPANRFLSVNRSELDWSVELTAAPTLPQHPLNAERELDVHGGARIFVPVVDTGGRWDLRDPEVGDLLAVVPVLAPGYGMAEERLFAEFHLLPTAQGVVVQPLSERVDVDPRRNGVRVLGEEGLILSSGRLPERLAQAEDAGPSINPEDGELDATGQMVDYVTWSRGSDKRYVRSLRELLRELAQAPRGGRNAVRWDLARFFFTHDRAAEGLGILNVIASEDGTATADREFRFFRGAMRLMLSRVEEAVEDLTDKSLEADPHAALWRSVLYATQKNWPEAKRQYASGASVLKYYPPHHQARFRLAAAEAASMTNDITMLRVELHGIDSSKLSDDQRTLTAYFQGRLLEMDSEKAAAEEQYSLVAKAGYRPNAVKAELARIKLLASSGEMSLEDQIKGLESLRYKWRGGDFELEVLQTLGRKYIEDGDPANGLQTLRRAITFFPETPQAPGIAHEMNQSFRNLFLEGRADEMSAVSALALYYEFRELTPAGEDGDEMIRKLSDRLVSIDLLDQASELLDHQVKYRLRGIDKAKVGARLAIVNLLNQQPKDALMAIRISRYPRVDQETAIERRHLEARALTEMKRHTEALRVLEGDTGNGAEQIRADIFWGAKEWRKAAIHIERILARSLVDNELMPSERFQVMRLAVALSLSGDRDGLDRALERFGSKMANTPDEAPFKILTSNIARTDVKFRELAGEIASVTTLETFMSNYREKNTPEADNSVN